MPDMVNMPPHYTQAPAECIEVIEALGLGYHDGNALKYLWRWRSKGNGVEDLKKARWYLDRLIQRMESNSQEPDHA